MGKYILVFGLGMLLMYLLTYFSTHKEARDEMFSKMHSTVDEFRARVVAAVAKAREKT